MVHQNLASMVVPSGSNTLFRSLGNGIEQYSNITGTLVSITGKSGEEFCFSGDFIPKEALAVVLQSTASVELSLSLSPAEYATKEQTKGLILYGTPITVTSDITKLDPSIFTVAKVKFSSDATFYLYAK